MLKGGATADGARAAASHTGSLATDDRVFDGMCRQAGAVRAATVEEAFEIAAALRDAAAAARARRSWSSPRPAGGASSPPTRWPRTALELLALPDDLRDALDELLPPRWSRNNPVDLAGGETQDTIPDVLEAVARIPTSTP